MLVFRDWWNATDPDPMTVDLSFVWSSVLVWDSTVFALTVYRVLTAWSRWRGGLLNVLLRDGECEHEKQNERALANYE